MSADLSSLEGGLHADNRAEHIGITTALLVLATVFVGLRFLARYIHGAGFAKDDWACIAALIATFATGGLNYGMLYWGLGRHAAALSLEELEMFFKYLLAFECIYVTGVAAVKICLLLMYVRIFPTRGFRIASSVLGGLTIAWWLSICLVCIFQCNPIRKAWQPWLEFGKCIDLKASFIGNAVPNIATDVAIICLPIYQVWKLQINKVQKISLMGVFLLGTFVFFASIYRFTTIMQFEITDTTWTLATACTWCVVEVAVGLISVCLPTLRPLLVKVSRKFGSSLRDISNKYGSNQNTELMTIGGGGSKGAGRSFNQLSGGENEPYGTTTFVGRAHSRQASGMDKDIESSGDEAPLRPGKTHSAVIHINRDFKRTETSMEGPRPTLPEHKVSRFPMS